MFTTRKPRGYAGIDHITRGGDIIAVLRTVHLPEQTLGPELARRLKDVRPDAWYPVQNMIEMLESMDRKLGGYHLRQVGWTIFNSFHIDSVKQRFDNARALIHAFDSMYREGNKGTQIGGWRVLSFGTDGRAEVENTTLHHCQMEEGIVSEALRAIGVDTKISQTKCFRKGDDLCVFLIQSSCSAALWNGKPES